MEEWMKLALDLAARGRGGVSPNPMVGAVILKGDRIIGQGWHEKRGEAHAEINALRSLKESAQGASLVVTLEPCCHWGKTPPCTQAIIEAGISKVVIAGLDPNPLVAGRGIKILKEAGIEVRQGLLADREAELNKVFRKYMATKRPYVLMKAAMTLDGKIATQSGHSRWISGEASRRKVHELRHAYQAVMVGINTVLADDPQLTCRLGQGSIDPWRVVVDRAGRIPLESELLQTAKDIPTFICCSQDAAEDKLTAMKELGAEVITYPGSGRIPLDWLMDELGRKEVDSLLLEGGGGLNGAMLSKDLVDEVALVVAPKMVGGAGPSPVAGEGVQTMAEAWQFQLGAIERIGEDLWIQAWPKRRQDVYGNR